VDHHGHRLACENPRRDQVGNVPRRLRPRASASTGSHSRTARVVVDDVEIAGAVVLEREHGRRGASSRWIHDQTPPPSPTIGNWPLAHGLDRAVVAAP
jgi:hypothetical protein